MSFLHGWSRTPTHNSWMSMLSRCYSPTEREEKFYKGVTVCDRWRESEGVGFLNFLEDMGVRPDGTSLDRIDTNGDYTPLNCRWAGREDQSFNQKMQTNNTSGCAGVYWSKAASKWAAYINKGRVRSQLGLFESFDEAVRARKKAEVDLYGYNV